MDWMIRTKGNDGHGNYAGVAVTILGIVRIPVFWIDFFANDAAMEHDRACDSIDWSKPDKAYTEYKAATKTFFISCLAKADDVPQLIFEAQIANFFASRWGDLRYELSRK